MNIKHKMNDDDESPKKIEPYPVYRNDIKYRKHRNIDPSLAIWTDDVKQDFHNKDTDSIDYRIEECLQEKGEMLDLSHMNKNCFNLLFSHKTFPKIKTTLQHVFARDSDLTIIPNLECLSVLLTLDVSSNNLTSLPILPRSLEELFINDNSITCVMAELPNLLRFNGDDNLISEMSFSKKLERIHLKNNPILQIPAFNNLYFLDISSTKITKLYPCPNLKYLDVSSTGIVELPEMNSLEILLCNDSSLKDITKLKNLKSLAMIRSNINRVPYFKDLKNLTYAHADCDKFDMSRNYRIKFERQNKMNIVEMTLHSS